MTVMEPVDPQTRIESLDRDACLRLLAGDEVGRLGVVSGGAPLIFVVNYVLDGADVVFRSDSGTKVDHGMRAPACFEVDGFDRSQRSGWSVLVSGRLEEVTRYNGRLWDRITRLAVQPWASGDKTRWMRLVPTSITGRRVSS